MNSFRTIIILLFTLQMVGGCDYDKETSFFSEDCKTDFTGFPDIPGWSFAFVPVDPRIQSIRSIHFFGENKGLIITINEIWLTENEGGHWEKVLGPVFLRVDDISFINEQIGFIAAVKDVNLSLLKTNDGGKTWSTLFYQPEDAIDRFSFADSLAGIAQFVHNEGGNTFDSVFIAKTIDGGLTWQSLPELTASIFLFPEIKMFSNGFGYVQGKFDEIYLTNNFGESWSSIFAIPNYLDVQLLNDSIAFVGGFDGLFKTNTEGTWIKISDHKPNWFHFFSPTDGISLQTLASKFMDFGSTECNAFFSTTDGGLSWNEGPPSINFFINDLNFVNDHLGYGLTYENDFRIVKIFR